MSKKKSKLSERGARMPEVRQGDWERLIPAYLETVAAPGSESAKSHRFAMLLGELFGEQPGFIEEYVAGIERYVKVKEKDRILRGAWITSSEAWSSSSNRTWAQPWRRQRTS